MDGADENFEICQHTFPESATIKCLEKNRTNYPIYILATPCNNIAECENDEDEQCDKSSIVTIIISLVLFIFTLIAAYSINHFTLKVPEKDAKQNVDQCPEPNLKIRIIKRLQVKHCVFLSFYC